MLRLLQILYHLRQEKGAQRQTTFESELKYLDGVMRGQHPYQLSAHYIQELMKAPFFLYGAAGNVASLPKQEYLFRISTISKLLSYTTSWTSTLPRKEDLPWVAFRLFEAQLGRTMRWLPLKRYANGEFCSPRNFSFWSGQELAPSPVSQLLENTHKVGVPNDWLDEVCVIMRCRTEYLDKESLTHVPTVLDSFDSHIFHPTKEADSPLCGIAINLNLSSSLASGRDEYVVGPIGTEAIEIYPVHIPSGSTPQIDSFSLVLLALLEAYYVAM